MFDDLEQINEKMLGILEDLQQSVVGIMENTVKDTLSCDISQKFSQTFTRQGNSSFDPYQVLELDRSASREEIKKRYRELLHKLHPDTAGIGGTGFLLRIVMASFEMIRKERGW